MIRYLSLIIFICMNICIFAYRDIYDYIGKNYDYNTTPTITISVENNLYLQEMYKKYGYYLIEIYDINNVLYLIPIENLIGSSYDNNGALILFIRDNYGTSAIQVRKDCNDIIYKLIKNY